MRIVKKTKQSRKKKLINKLLPGLFVGLIGVGGMFTAYQPYKNHLVKNTEEKVLSVKQTAQTVKKNQEKVENAPIEEKNQVEKESPMTTAEEATPTEPDYDPTKVTELTMADVLEGNRNADRIVQQFGIGKIVVPNLGIQLPILVGIANTNLAVGAGTMKAGQQMGIGNYALAGHHMKNKNFLFGPLEDAKEGQSIYLTNYETIYHYIISSNKIVGPNDGHVINDVVNQKLITLITCAEEGKKRYAIQGTLSETYAYDSVPSDIKQLFN